MLVTRTAYRDTMAKDIPLTHGDDALPNHVFNALAVPPTASLGKIGGSIQVIEKRPVDGPITLLTAGASRVPTDTGEKVELAVEVVEGQQGAAMTALRIVCDDMAANRRVPPVGAPWRNDQPFVKDTAISAIMVTPSRWGADFDEVVAGDRIVVGRVATLRMLTDAEAAYAGAHGWDALVEAAGSIDAFLDVTRESAVVASVDPESDGDRLAQVPVFLTMFHAQYPPRWLTFTGRDFRSVTGWESPEYMADASNHEVWSVATFRARFPWTDRFMRVAKPGQTAQFTGVTGDYVLEDD
ncbi:Suppressor of fused protein (SUFU) [Ruaniaceae bacterium KH17]|nr:Suppressor of fused protein (SUFU) [Ruaniaceae bacterium KH17]